MLDPKVASMLVCKTVKGPFSITANSWHSIACPRKVELPLILTSVVLFSLFAGNGPWPMLTTMHCLASF